MTVYYSHLDPGCKSPFGAVPEGTGVRFRLSCSDPSAGFSLLIKHEDSIVDTARFSSDGNGQFEAEYIYGTRGLYYYAIQCGEMYICEGGSLSKDGEWFQQTVYAADYVQPQGYAGGMIYQIFPDRFAIDGGINPTPFGDRIIHSSHSDVPCYKPEADGQVKNRDYYGGNLRGIISKLGYLESLGTTIIYLNPIFEAHSNHRYDTADYMKIDPMLGTEEEFRELCSRASDRGIRIVLDGVFNHTGSDSVYFNSEGRYPDKGAANDPKSPYRSWYKFSPDGSYKGWWGFKTLPEVNEDDPTYKEFICGENGVIAHWMKLGASGFRLDVADELPDRFIRLIRQRIKSFGDDKILIGEVWEDASNKVSYGEKRQYLFGEELDSCMNYPFRNAILKFMKDADGCAFVETIEDICDHYPKPMLDLMMNPLSTHDTERIITALTVDSMGDKDWQASFRLTRDGYLRGVELEKLAAVLQFTLPGIPSVYYGDEIGMQGCKDPFNRCFYDWENGDDNLRSFYKKLSKIRRDTSQFADGAFIPVSCSPGSASYLRADEEGAVLIAVNRSDTEAVVGAYGRTFRIEPWRYVIEKI
ncbi:MAG: glycoside hydrolase family 13 protein [Oscillospiraceae bacterium]|jgi:glycosidase